MLKLLKAKEVAEIIGVQESTIYQWTHQGYIPHIKVGKMVRFNVEDVLKWLSKMKTRGRVHRKYKFKIIEA